MKVILLQDIPKVGHKYEIKDVRAGFARNFLIANNHAVLASPKEIKKTESERVRNSEARETLRIRVGELIQKIQEQTFAFERKANTKGGLFAAVLKEDIQKELQKHSFGDLEDYIVVSEPIKKIGRHSIDIVIDGEKRGEFILEIKATEGEEEVVEPEKII